MNKIIKNARRYLKISLIFFIFGFVVLGLFNFVAYPLHTGSLHYNHPAFTRAVGFLLKTIVIISFSGVILFLTLTVFLYFRSKFFKKKISNISRE